MHNKPILQLGTADQNPASRSGDGFLGTALLLTGCSSGFEEWVKCRETYFPMGTFKVYLHLHIWSKHYRVYSIREDSCQLFSFTNCLPNKFKLILEI